MITSILTGKLNYLYMVGLLLKLLKGIFLITYNAMEIDSSLILKLKDNCKNCKHFIKTVHVKLFVLKSKEKTIWKKRIQKREGQMC